MKSKLFDRNFTLTPEEKRFAEEYDKDQSVFRVPKADPSFDKVAQKTRENYDALEKAKLEYKRLTETLPDDSCRSQFQRWVQEQNNERHDNNRSPPTK